MTQGKNIQRKLMRLEHVLDTFGADPMRWPSDERRSLESFVEKNSDARLLLNEARALGRVMDAAPVSEASAALKSRIVAGVVDDAGPNALVVPIEVARNSRVRIMSERHAGAIWPAAALAASFALGLYLGVAGIGAAAVDGAFEIAYSSAPGGDAEGISWLDGGGAVNEDGPL